MTGNTGSASGRPQARQKGLGRRNWPVFALGLPALLVALTAVAYWVVVPGLVGRLVTSVEESLARLLGTPVAHGTMTLEGLSRLVLTDLKLGRKGQELFVMARVDVEIDPFSFTEGMPSVLAVSADGVQVRGVRYADGTDNVTEVVQRLAERLQKKEQDAAGGEGGRLAKLLRQTPKIALRNVAVEVGLETVEGDRAVVHPVLTLTNGRLDAVNPNLSMQEREYRLSAAFDVPANGGQATLEADIDFAKRQVLASAAVTPPLPVEYQGQRLELAGLRARTGEFVELTLGRVTLTNPLQDPEGARDLLAAALTKIGQGHLAERIPQLADPGTWLRRKLPGLLDRVARLRYPKAAWEGAAEDLARLADTVVRRILSEAGGEQVGFDGCRVLYLSGRTRTDQPTRKVTVTLDRGGRLGAATYEEVLGTGVSDLTFDFTTPTRILHAAGEVHREGETMTVDAAVTAALDDPLLKLTAKVTHREGAWGVTFQGQMKSDRPQLALSADVRLGDGGWTGTVEAAAALPGIGYLKHGKLVLAPGAWSADAEGNLTLPEGRGEVAFAGTLDSASGLKRLTADAVSQITVPVGEWDLFVSKLRVGRDAVVHLEDLAVAEHGANRSKAVLQVADVAVTLTRPWSEIPEVLRQAPAGGGLQELAGSLVGSVEVVQPVMIVRQPPTLSVAPVQEEGEEGDVPDKITDNLADGTHVAIVMNEEYRKALSSLVRGTTSMVDRLVAAALKLGDRIPLTRLEVREGKFEYSEAVSPQDRLLSDLSDFNLTLTKTKLPRSLGGQFSVAAQFATPTPEGKATSTLKAEVDLATGNLTGTFDVEKMALFPYRFFLPAAVGTSKLSALEDAHVGFAFAADVRQFSVWGRGRLSELALVSPRVSARPIEHVTFDVALGDGPGSGLLFDLNQNRLTTAGPLVLSAGALKRLEIGFAVDASVPDFPTFALTVGLPQTPVNDLLSSLPHGLVSTVAGMRVAGDLGFQLRIAGNSADLNTLDFTFDAQESGIAVDAPAPGVNFNELSGVFRHHPPTAPDRTVWVGAGDKYVPLDRISPWLVLAVTACEDGGFFRHSGFNTLQIKNSLIRDLQTGRFARGASTLTMQLMKNLFLSHEKTVARKLQEILLTWLVEKEIRKDKLIEIYLNVIEFGNGIYGVKEACDYYFGGLPPADLSPAQAAFLASFIPYPRPFHAKFKDGFFAQKRTKAWEKWWARRLDIVKRVVRAMSSNCSSIESRCPASVGWCRGMWAACADPAGELQKVQNLSSLDALFRPRTEPPPLPVDAPPPGEQEEM